MFTETTEIFESVRENSLELIITPESFDSTWIINCICQMRGVEPEELQEKYRGRRIVLTRQLCMYFLKMHTKLNLSQIGEKFGQDHATVCHARKTIENLLETSQRTHDVFHLEVENIYRKIHGAELIQIPVKKPMVVVSNKLVSQPVLASENTVLPALPPRRMGRLGEAELARKRLEGHEAWNRIIPRRVYPKLGKDSFVGCCF